MTETTWPAPGKPGADVVADPNIREGAYYRTRGGDVVGPMRITNHPIYPLITLGNQWAKCGRWGASGKEHPLDLISEVYVNGTPDEVANREDVKWHEGYAVGVLDVRRGTAFGEPDTHYAALQKRVAELRQIIRYVAGCEHATASDEDLLEQVAAAICRMNNIDPTGHISIDGNPFDWAWKHFLPQARAALGMPADEA